MALCSGRRFYARSMGPALVLVTIFLMSMPPVSLSQPLVNLKGTEWEQAGEEHGVDPHLLYSVALMESRELSPEDSSLVRPSPYAINAGGVGFFPETLDEAEALVEALSFSMDSTNIDVGVMQISLKWHDDKYDNPKDLLDTSTAINVGARILKEAMDSSPDDEVLGAGRYHNWANERRSRAYGRKVIAIRNAINPSSRKVGSE